MRLQASQRKQATFYYNFGERKAQKIDSSSRAELTNNLSFRHTVTMLPNNTHAKPSWTFSSLSLLFMMLLTSSVVLWSDSLPSKYDNDRQRTERQLIASASAATDSISNVPDDINDDATRDGTCKEYLYNFLNGTTDAKDECDGMLNAFQAADCVDDKNIMKFYFGTNKHHKFHVFDDDNTTKDDKLIDDYVENFECCSSIYTFYTKNCHPPQLASFRLLGIVGVLVICGLVKSLIHTVGLGFLPDAGAFILVGALVGGILSLINPHCELHF